jgi:hypothetical protein
MLRGLGRNIRQARLQQRHAVLDFDVEPFQFFREAPDFAGVHDGLWHVCSSRFSCSLKET